MGVLRVYRVAIQDELQKAFEVRREVFINEQGVPESLEVDSHEGESEHFLAEISGKPVGTGRFRIEGDRLKFERIAVFKEMRGRGIGKAIMEEMVRVGRKEYPTYTPYLSAQTKAIPFYEGLGWITVGEEYIEAGIPHKGMILPGKKSSEESAHS